MASRSDKLENTVNNFTSTPCLPGDYPLVSILNNGEGPIRGNMSAGEISAITESRPSTRLRVDSFRPPVNATPTRDPSYGYPLSYLTEGAATTNLTTNTIREIIPRRDGLTLTCHKVSVRQREDRFSFRENLVGCKEAVSRNQKQEVILDDISAYFPPGMNALMGPSGCGKTSLLTVLSLRNEKFEGSIRLNGNLAPRNFAKICGYSIQDDILNPYLTVKQHIWFSLCLRRGGSSMSRDEKHALVGDILKSLRLELCAEVKVGDLSNSAISGGERKRIGIGMELVAAPKIVFLDEPTSSLDSTTSKYIVRILKCLADNGRTIILSIHQPSFKLFRMFNNLTLLAKGRLMYHGPAAYAFEYFTSLGFPHQPHYSPPDFFLDILFGRITSGRLRRSTRSTPHPGRRVSVKINPLPFRNVGERDLRRGIAEDDECRADPDRKRNLVLPIVTITRDSQASLTVNNNVETAMPKDGSVFYMSDVTSPCFLDVNMASEGYASSLDMTTDEGMKKHAEIACSLAEEYLRSEIGQENDFHLYQIRNQTQISSELQDVLGQSSVLSECILLSHRGLKASIRLCRSLVVMNVVIGLLFGMFYYRNRSDGRPSVQNRLGMFFYLSLHGIIVPAIISAKNFATSEEALFEHEKRGGHYRPISYCVSRLIILVLIRLLSSAALSTIVYWMTGLKHDGGVFLRFVATMFMSGLACDTLCLTCVVTCKSFAVGRAVAILYESLTSVFAGFLVNLETTFPWLSWIKYISITRYCFASWVIGEFSAACLEDENEFLPSTWGTRLAGSPSRESEECGTASEQLAMREAVGQDRFMQRHIWSNHLTLLLFSSIFVLACYFQMRKIS